MPYRTAYRRPVQRTGPRANKYDAGCSRCGRLVPAGTGVLTGNRDIGYEVRHGDRTWHGSPVSGQWVGGCEDATDQPVYEVRAGRAAHYGVHLERRADDVALRPVRGRAVLRVLRLAKQAGREVWTHFAAQVNQSTWESSHDQ